MSDRSENEARPAKRARLDDNAPAGSAESPAPASLIAPVAAQATTTAIDEDLEREIRAGITEYVCPDNLGFTGVLKQRYTDFLVNEIGLDGQVVHLKSTKVPEKENKKPDDKNTKQARSETKNVAGEQVTVQKDVDMADAQNEAVGAQTATIEAEKTPNIEPSLPNQSGDQEEESKQEAEEPVRSSITSHQIQQC